VTFVKHVPITMFDIVRSVIVLSILTKPVMPSAWPGFYRGNTPGRI
jgi:hypothetical protein